MGIGGRWSGGRWRKAFAGGFYQGKLPGGTDARWERIRAALRPEDGSLLDLGCNIGVFTRRAADLGMIALGCDADPMAVARAVRMNRGTPGLAFMHLELTPRSVLRLPACDVALCLSVHHHWMRAAGEEAAWEMVAAVIGRTNRKFFFEPASRRSKYHPASPAFTDLDRASIEDYNTGMLRKVAGDSADITCLGETPSLGREKFRILFLVEKRQQPRAGDGPPPPQQ